MAVHTSEIVPVFDFSVPSRMELEERFNYCIRRARQLAVDYQGISGFPCVPDTGATDAELVKLESELGRPLPVEYRTFLSRCRYLKLDDGYEVGGLRWNGMGVTASPWISGEHRQGVDYLVFANYWRYADGDQLMFDVNAPGSPVVVYLHEHGPLYECYAPSFSLALWRLVHEME